MRNAIKSPKKWAAWVCSPVSLLAKFVWTVRGFPGELDDVRAWPGLLAWGIERMLVHPVDAVILFAIASVFGWGTSEHWLPKFRTRILRKSEEGRREYTLRTVEEICEEYHNLSLRHRYSLTGEFKSPDIGNWLTIVNEELKWKPIVSTESIVVHIQDRVYEVELHFDRKYLGELAPKKAGDHILAEGKIADVGCFGLKLCDCILVV